MGSVIDSGSFVRAWLRQKVCVYRRFAASVALCGPWPKRASCGVLDKVKSE